MKDVISAREKSTVKTRVISLTSQRTVAAYSVKNSRFRLAPSQIEAIEWDKRTPVITYVDAEYRTRIDILIAQQHSERVLVPAREHQLKPLCNLSVQFEDAASDGPPVGSPDHAFPLEQIVLR